jgi:uncharacterized protein DUF4189
MSFRGGAGVCLAAMMRTVAAALALGMAAQQPALAAVKPSPRNAWGAVAYSSATGAYGFAVDQPSKRSAESEAFRQCGADCDVIKTFRNACGAIAETDRHYAWETGASREIAEMKARKKCGGSECRVSVWACTRGR